jgi:hypothetical protein
MQDRQDPNYDGFWKIRQVFYTLNAKFSELYHTPLSKKYPTLFFSTVSNGQGGGETKRSGIRDFHAHA